MVERMHTHHRNVDDFVISEQVRVTTTHPTKKDKIDVSGYMTEKVSMLSWTHEKKTSLPMSSKSPNHLQSSQVKSKGRLFVGFVDATECKRTPHVMQTETPQEE